MLTAQLSAENVVGTERDFSVRTGVLRFKADWPGVFIRGDDALGYAATIRALLRQAQEEQFVQWGRLEELADLLESCRIKDGTERPRHHSGRRSRFFRSAKT